MPLYNGPEQQAECMRSGKKCKASELVRDGRNPSLMVLPEWADDYHPQEHPFEPDDIEGSAHYQIAPENMPPTLLTLHGVYNGAGSLAMDWTLAQLLGPRAERYILYKSTDGAAPVAFGTYPIDYTNTTAHVPYIGVQKDYGKVYYVQQADTDPNAGVTNPFDSHFAAVTLLLHCDGVDGGVVFTDSSAIGHIMVPQGHANTSTANPKWGTATYNAGAGFSNAVATSNTVGGSLDLSTGDFTVEGWFDTLSANVFTQPLIGCGSLSGPNGWYIAFAPTPQRQLFAVIYTPTLLPGTQSVQGPALTSQDQWHHFAFIRSGTLFRIFVDGVHNPPGDIIYNGSIGPTDTTFYVGAVLTFGAVSCDWLDEVRVTKGYARYLNDFAVPVGPFADISTATGHVYTYYIAAVDSLGDAVAVSNTLTLTVSNNGAGVLS